jgi:hypothetical protein
MTYEQLCLDVINSSFFSSPIIPSLLPAYDRDYSKKADIASDLNANKDFLMSSFNLNYCPINKEQLIKEGFNTVVVRYGNQRKVTSLKLVKGEFK